MEARVKRGVTKGVKIFFVVLFGIGVFLLVGYVLMLLWNWLMPDLFGVPRVDYWQAFGILILAKLLFGFGSHGSGGGKRKSGKHRSEPMCRNGASKLKEKWSYYDEFWSEEGEAAFNTYIERRRSEGKESPGEQHTGTDQ